MVDLIEIAPGRWVVKKSPRRPARSDLPRPYVISDTMDPVEQVDGKFYTSKREFRAVGKSLGLIEVGNEKPKPRTRASTTVAAKEKRRQSIKIAVEKYRSGHRV